MSSVDRLTQLLMRVAANQRTYRERMETVATQEAFKNLPRNMSLITTRKPNGVSVTLTGPNADKQAAKVADRLRTHGDSAAGQVINRV